MEALDILTIDAISTNGTPIPFERKRKINHPIKIFVDGELYESRHGNCIGCDLSIEYSCGIFKEKPFTCQTRPTIHFKRVSNGST